jgi:hypothetical protein
MAGRRESQTWQDGLVARHPRLFHLPAAGPEAAQGYPNCEQGWQELLELACIRIEAALGGAFNALQLKQKFGTLRFYWSGDMPDAAKAKVEEAIALAVARSACTCEVCGKEGWLHNRGGWFATACAEHAQGDPAPVRPGFENLHIVRRLEAGRAQIVTCRRYIRDKDSFVDVDPQTLGIEE